jgi:hypothetical protein
VAACVARRSPASFWALLALLLTDLALPSRAGAQSAWLPVAGEGSVSVTFQALEYGGHFDQTGQPLAGTARSRAFVGLFEFEYGLTDRLALTAELPYIASRFTGRQDEPIMVLINRRYDEYRRTYPDSPADQSLDTGDYYATFQDFGFALRYNILDRGLVVTPVVAATIPSHPYRTIGEAAPGIERRALHTGVNVGRLLDPLLPNAYIHGRYVYSFVQRFRGIPLDRSSAELEVGYAITPTVEVRALGNWMRTHGGVGFSEAYEDLSLFLEHDRLLPSRHWRLGGATTVSLTDSLDLDAAVVTFLAGADTRYGTGVNVGLTWRFLTPRARRP